MIKSMFKNKITVIVCVGIVAILLLSLGFLWEGHSNSTQASPSFAIGVEFEGEYKIGNSDWKPIVKGEHISSTQGDVMLRGIFQMIDPIENEPMGPLFEGASVYLYFNHIGGYTSTADGETIVFDFEHEYFGEDNCSVFWGSVLSAGEDPILIVLKNPHRYGNENAIDELLANMSTAEGIDLKSEMLEKGAPMRNVGLLVFIVSLIILGIAAFSTVIHIKKCKEMWLIGLMSLCAGGYLMFDAFGVTFWNESFIINTRMLGLCMMFYMLFGVMLITSTLNGRAKKVARLATLLSGASILCCILLSLFNVVYFYDTWIGWAIAQIVVAVILTVCLIAGIRRATASTRVLHIASILFLSAFPVDVIATAEGWWEGGFVTKFVFFAIFIGALFVVLHIIPAHINAAVRAKELEAEQQQLKQELQESRISIMLSQMRPHFIFNALNTIYHLCDIDTDKAKSTISSFSTYLRNNINNLGESDMIPFEKELSFVNTYLDIEKVRFDDELIVSYDIGVSDFKLPVLTVQPIVENAVKHGTSKKEGVSTLHIATRETEKFYEIKISDTGVGFDVNQHQDDGRKHIGVNNVRQRLETLCNGTLIIESTIGVGTTALIQIPKTEVKSI